MNLLLLSDAHIGQYDINLYKTVDIINKEYDFDKIATLGDMIDLWRCNTDDLLLEQKDNLEFLREQTKFNVIGNHDYILKEITDIEYFEEYKYKNIKYIHGYQYEMLRNDIPYNTQEDYINFCKKMCYSDKFTATILDRIHSIYKSGKKTNDDKFLLIIKLIKNLTKENIIMGHYHRLYLGEQIVSVPALCNGECLIYNTKNKETEYVNIVI